MWRWTWRILLLGLGLVLGAGIPLWWSLEQELERDFKLEAEPVPSRVYARPLELAVGRPLSGEVLKLELAAARYLERAGAPVPGSFAVEAADRYLIHTRRFGFGDGLQPAERVRLRLNKGAIAGVERADGGRALERWRVDPAPIATLYGEQAIDRMPLPLEEMPPVLVMGLQAVEDRNFKHHQGIDPWGILRAIWSNLREGELRQGGSTITQQLVKNEILTPERSLERKLKELVLAVMLEARYDKRTILEAYLNRAFLGQNGNQPVRGFGAAADFYFGRPLDELDTGEIALLIGMLRAPSALDPRRHPERAKRRRDVVLAIFAETGLIGPAEHQRLRAAELTVIPKPSAARERHPAFVALVRDQLRTAYDPAVLGTRGLKVLTTLDPHVQLQAERTLAETLTQVDRSGQIEGAVVVTDAQNGELLAVVGGRDARASGFNRARDAKRPVGSLLKPFVYLLALSEPQRYSLGSMLLDAPFALKLPSGQRWSPTNYDGLAHGEVALIDALARSYNLATARLGLELGVDRLVDLLANFGVRTPKPAPPALILGALDLSPLQVAQLYQSLASGGRILPLTAVREVLDAEGRPLARYPTAHGRPASPEVVKLLIYALNETTRSGTARALSESRRLRIEMAGKTGTSNDKRDSWYAGFTGAHLGVVWLGRDDNQPTPLSGASGALRVWRALFERIPTRPLGIDFDPATRWVAYDTGEGCERWRFLPVLGPHDPPNARSCMDLLFGP